MAIYTYDAWGKCTIVSDTSGCNIATVNPFRYGGYYFDIETELYYLQSRYYDPSIGRFINSDEPMFSMFVGDSIDGNIFIYCLNNGINGKDDTGYLPWKLIVIITAGIVVAIAKLWVLLDSKEYKRAPSGGKFLQVITTFTIGFIQGSLTALVAMSNKKFLKYIFAGIAAVALLYLNEGKLNTRKAVKVFLNSFSASVFVSGTHELIKELCSKIITQKVLQNIVEYLIEEFFNGLA